MTVVKIGTLEDAIAEIIELRAEIELLSIQVSRYRENEPKLIEQIERLNSGLGYTDYFEEIKELRTQVTYYRDMWLAQKAEADTIRARMPNPPSEETSPISANLSPATPYDQA